MIWRLRRWLEGPPQIGERYDAFAAIVALDGETYDGRRRAHAVTQPGAVDRQATIWPALVRAFVGHRLEELGRAPSEAVLVRRRRRRNGPPHPVPFRRVG